MTAHLLEKHENCERPYCGICDGGLANCIVCHGAEASLPTDCPGRWLTHKEQNSIVSGDLDYVGGEWISPAAWKRALHLYYARRNAKNMALEYAIKACEDEKVDAGATGICCDVAYNLALDHAIEAIRVLIQD